MKSSAKAGRAGKAGAPLLWRSASQAECWVCRLPPPLSLSHYTTRPGITIALTLTLYTVLVLLSEDEEEEEDGIQCEGDYNDDKQSSSSPGPAARSEELLSEAELNVRAGPD